MKERTPIPEIYEETLERTASRIGELPYFGIETHDERINKAYHRAEACGCQACKNRFWHAVEEAVEAERRHSDEDIIAAIERYSPLINEVADFDDDLGDD